MQVNCKYSLAWALLALAVYSGAAHAEMVLVVAQKNPLTALSIEQASDIFLGESHTFPGGAPAVPFDLPDGSAARDEFYAKVTGKSAAQLKAYWAKMIFTGKGRPPKELADSAAVKKQLADNPSCIGYIDKAAVDGSVKVVLSVRK